MRAINALRELERYPVFDVTKARSITGKGQAYARLFVHRLKERGLVQAVERNKYTMQNDPLIVAAHLVWPSYVSCQTALRYHNFTNQILNEIIVVTTKPKKEVVFKNTVIRFIKTKPKNFFGFEKKQQGNFSVPVADAEKALLDTALYRQLSVAEIRDIMKEHIHEMDKKKVVNYLLRICSGSLARRLGFLFDRLGYDCYAKLKKYVDHNYIRLDYSAPAAGRKDRKWGLTINIKGKGA